MRESYPPLVDKDQVGATVVLPYGFPDVVHEVGLVFRVIRLQQDIDHQREVWPIPLHVLRPDLDLQEVKPVHTFELRGNKIESRVVFLLR